MRQHIPLYLLTVALLGAAIFLRSPMIAVATVALWGVSASENVLTRKNKDADIAEIQATLAAQKARLAVLERDVVNVAERARTILGENF